MISIANAWPPSQLTSRLGLLALLAAALAQTVVTSRTRKSVSSMHDRQLLAVLVINSILALADGTGPTSDMLRAESTYDVLPVTCRL